MFSTRRGFLRGLVVAVAATALPPSGQWGPLGQQDPPEIQMLALGIDGLNVFAATRDGVMRMSIG